MHERPELPSPKRNSSFLFSALMLIILTKKSPNETSLVPIPRSKSVTHISLVDEKMFCAEMYMSFFLKSDLAANTFTMSDPGGPICFRAAYVLPFRIYVVVPTTMLISE
jgi:hypothetical protein